MSIDKENTSRLILLGIITAAHGIRGQVKLRSFTAVPEDITSYGPLRDKAGKIVDITVTGSTKDTLIAQVKGITSREAAEALRNTQLYVPRSALPPPQEHEYYHEDLVGLKLVTDEGLPYGVIAAMHNFGAGDLAGILKESGEEEMLSFTRAIFTSINFEKGISIIRLPEFDADE